MARLRLAMVVPALAKGGGVAAVARFLKEAARRSERFDLQLISLSTSADDEASVRLARPCSWRTGIRAVPGHWEGVPFTHVGATATELEFQRYRPRGVLTQALAGCDLIQVVCGVPAWGGAVVGLGKPVALQVATRTRVERRLRDADPRGPIGWWRRGMTEITDRLDDRALRRVDAIQVENPWMLEYARKINVDRDVDLRYAPPGINAVRYSPILSTSRGQDPYILCVGRLDDPRKNIGLLLGAYMRLPKELRARVRLVFAGSSPPPDRFWKEVEVADLRDRVSYVARPGADSLLDLYRSASVFALPSDEEGFGMVLLEAMACGVPVVSTRSGGPDGIITDGKDGYLVPLDDAEAMAARLLVLLQDHAHNVAMGEAARRTIEERYDERVAGEVFLDMWDRMLHKARKR